MKNSMIPYNDLINQIGDTLAKGREQEQAGRSVNTILVQTYWQIGCHIVEFGQGGKNKAVYGAELLVKLSKDLTLAYGKGFSRSNLIYIRKFYLTFPKAYTASGQFVISETPSRQLRWSHYFEILKADNELEMSFYIKQCEKEKWSTRELKRQMKSMLFHRLSNSMDKTSVLDLAKNRSNIQSPNDIN